MNIICFGDSITMASDHAEGARWPTVLQAKFSAWRPGEFKVYNRGVNGDTSALGFSRFEDDVIPLLPGLLLVEFGINDCNHKEWARVPAVDVEEFKKNLLEFARVTKTLGGRCAFIVNHPLDLAELPQGNGVSFAENLVPYNEATREVAKETKSFLIDLPHVMRRREIALREFVQEDGIHLTNEGNHLYADIVFEELKAVLQ